MPVQGRVRDAIIEFLSASKSAQTVAAIRAAVTAKLGPTPPSSVRSYLGNNTPKLFVRTEAGTYRMTAPGKPAKKGS